MSSSFISPLHLRGSIIALGGAAYRLVRIYRGIPASKFGTMRVYYKADLECFHTMPQTAFVLRHRQERMLFLAHPELLQHGQKGVIQVTAQIRMEGPIDGPDRWLFVPSNFPAVPSAKDAIRIPPRKQTRDATKSEPLQPLDHVEELILDDGSDQFPRV